MVGKIVILLYTLLPFLTVEAFIFDEFVLCDRQITLYAGQSRSLRSPFYPAGYIPGSSCRYNIEAPVDYQIQITCQINMVDPMNDGSCISEKLYISEQGNRDVTNTDPICGTKPVYRTSVGNKLTLGESLTLAIIIAGYSIALFPLSVIVVGVLMLSRIVGGNETAPNEFPSTAALVSLTKVLYCGATIVSSRFVVTAAHCLRKTPSYASAVLVGDHDTTKGTDTNEARVYAILRYIEHPNYSSETDLNDIGLVQTVLQMTWSRGVGPVCLPFNDANSDFAGVDVIATGWGTTEFGGRKSDYLQKVDLTVLKNDDPRCKSAYPNIQKSQVCTYKEGKDTCQFDSGGGLYYRGLTGSRNFLIGKVSLGDGCASATPSLNTRITEFMSWIEQYTGSLCRRTLQ
ncbi:Venom serine protease [Pseudolycoriella hygida]|uniref:Venom serine protease n=1 Tax=Pseudolycoriella hygida TaxID=35572 RepID=A0A9Q0NBK2_9DIPT|nr:Venom serine protease [Pseudolycoriella hygida]